MFATLAHAFPLFIKTLTAHSATHGYFDCAISFFCNDRFDSVVSAAKMANFSLCPLVRLFCASTEIIPRTLLSIRPLTNIGEIRSSFYVTKSLRRRFHLFYDFCCDSLFHSGWKHQAGLLDRIIISVKFCRWRFCENYYFDQQLQMPYCSNRPNQHHYWLHFYFDLLA